MKQIEKGIKNEELLKVVSKKNNELITKITEELLHDYEVSCLPNSIISYWYPIELKLEERGEPVTIFESPNYQKHPDSSLFDFTANVIRRTLVKNDLDLLVDDLYEKIISCINEDVKVILFNKNKDYKGLKTTSWNKVYKMIMEDLC